MTYEESSELESGEPTDESAEPVTANFLCLVGRPFGLPVGFLGFLVFRLLMASFLFFLFLFLFGRPFGLPVGF